MSGDEKKSKTSSAAKKEAAPKDKESAPKDKAASGAATSKAEGGETAGAPPANYSRGEGQKPVTQAYKDNWNAIFAKKKKKR
jgi:hypothetical protein